MDKTIFTCTTCLHKPGKYDKFKVALDTIAPLLLPRHILMVVINEYGSEDHIVDTLRTQYPTITFIQKSRTDIGQARSLNMILKLAKDKGYKYWIQWEESWLASRDFVPEAIEIMEHHAIDQLQINEAWRDCRQCTIDDDNSAFTLVKTTFASFPDKWNGQKWPLFSLQPSINRVSAFIACGDFNESPSKWPVQFEYDYGVQLVKNGFTKAILNPSGAKRVSGHVSTYKTALASELFISKVTVLRVLISTIALLILITIRKLMGSVHVVVLLVSIVAISVVFHQTSVKYGDNIHGHVADSTI